MKTLRSTPVLLLLVLAVASVEAQPRVERPTFEVGDRWVRSDSAWDLVRVEDDRLTRSKGRAIVTASRPSEVSIELVNGLKGAGDLNRDGIVSLQELYEYVEQQVTTKSPLAKVRSR